MTGWLIFRWILTRWLLAALTWVALLAAIGFSLAGTAE
jgi:hypothetical protein